MVPIIITAAVTAVIVAVIVWFVATGIQQSKYKATVGSAEERSRTIIDDALKTAESKKREEANCPEWKSVLSIKKRRLTERQVF